MTHQPQPQNVRTRWMLLADAAGKQADDEDRRQLQEWAAMIVDAPELLELAKSLDIWDARLRQAINTNPPVPLALEDRLLASLAPPEGDVSPLLLPAQTPACESPGRPDARRSLHPIRRNPLPLVAVLVICSMVAGLSFWFAQSPVLSSQPLARDIEGWLTQDPPQYWSHWQPWRAPLALPAALTAKPTEWCKCPPLKGVRTRGYRLVQQGRAVAYLFCLSAAGDASMPSDFVQEPTLHYGQWSLWVCRDQQASQVWVLAYAGDERDMRVWLHEPQLALREPSGLYGL